MKNNMNKLTEMRLEAEKINKSGILNMKEIGMTP
jgi:hypothetical protein